MNSIESRFGINIVINERRLTREIDVTAHLFLRIIMNPKLTPIIISGIIIAQ